LNSAVVRNNGEQWNLITLIFDRPLSSPAGQENYFNIRINGNQAEIDELTGNSDSIQIILTEPILYGDIVNVSYEGGSISGIYHGLLADFENFPVENNIPIQTKSSEYALKQKYIELYPVPFKSYLNIKSLVNFNNVRIYEPLGKVVFEKSYSPAVSYDLINLSLVSGLHIIKITNKSTAVYLKIFSE